MSADTSRAWAGSPPWARRSAADRSTVVWSRPSVANMTWAWGVQVDEQPDVVVAATGRGLVDADPAGLGQVQARPGGVDVVVHRELRLVDHHGGLIARFPYPAEHDSGSARFSDDGCLAVRFPGRDEYLVLSAEGAVARRRVQSPLGRRAGARSPPTAATCGRWCPTCWTGRRSRMSVADRAGDPAGAGPPAGGVWRAPGAALPSSRRAGGRGVLGVHLGGAGLLGASGSGPHPAAGPGGGRGLAGHPSWRTGISGGGG
jgi:hypothetical protein